MDLLWVTVSALWVAHRRSIETEGKAMVVASVWGAKFIQFLAALSISTRSSCKKILIKKRAWRIWLTGRLLLFKIVIFFNIALNYYLTKYNRKWCWALLVLKGPPIFVAALLYLLPPMNTSTPPPIRPFWAGMSSPGSRGPIPSWQLRLQDGAPCHMTLTTRQLMEARMPDYTCCRIHRTSARWNAASGALWGARSMTNVAAPKNSTGRQWAWVI